MLLFRKKRLFLAAVAAGNWGGIHKSRILLAYFILTTTPLAAFPAWSQTVVSQDRTFNLNVGDSTTVTQYVACVDSYTGVPQPGTSSLITHSLFTSNEDGSGDVNHQLSAGTANAPGGVVNLPVGWANVPIDVESFSGAVPGTWYESTSGSCHGHAGPWTKMWEFTVFLKPFISGDTIAWYMGSRGSNDPVPVQYGPAKLQASPSPADLAYTGKTYTYTWTMTSNGCLMFDNNQYTETTTNNTVNVVATCASNTEIPVTVEVNGATSNPWNVQAHGPGSVVRTSIDQQSNPSGEIWQTIVHYAAYDNYSLPFPYPIPMNEDYVSPQPVTYSYPNGRFWPSYYANGGHDGPTLGNSTFLDQLNVNAVIPSLLNPTPTPLQTPMSTTLAFQFSGKYNLGSAKQGYGSCVQSLTWMYYVDHGDQTYSPPPFNCGGHGTGPIHNPP